MPDGPERASPLDWRCWMGQTVDDRSLDVLFRSARTHAKWQPRPVTDDTLRNLYELLKWAPTSANAAPARFAFLRSKEAKERLRDRKSTRLNSSHQIISYAVFCLKKKKERD